MKICIHNPSKKWADSVTGKGKFVCRLIPALRAQGVKVTEKNEKADITLHIGRIHFKGYGKQILRLGPAHIDTSQNYKKLNKQKWASVKRADAIVYQSHFSRKICRKFIGKKNVPSAIIPNGADPNFGKDDQLVEYKFQHKHNFICATRKWLPQKRLKYIEDAFIKVDIPESCLWVCGNILRKVQPRSLELRYKRNIVYTGIINEHQLNYFYAHCDAMIHITYLDACPNAVVEALVAGCPVICTGQGGTQELVAKGAGIVLPDKPYKYKAVNLNKPPKINVEKLAEAMKEYAVDDPIKERAHAPELYINNIAKQYVKFFKKLI